MKAEALPGFPPDDPPPELEPLLEELLLEVACMTALQPAVVPPLVLPLQVQSQAKLLSAVTAEAVPALQRPVVGALAKVPLADDPHTPLTVAAAALAVQVALVPPLVLAQIQVQGPLPATPSDVPALHRLVVGALLKLWPFADPHAPLVGVVVPLLLDELGPELEPTEHTQ
jgi:hypothetical protein